MTRRDLLRAAAAGALAARATAAQADAHASSHSSAPGTAAPSPSRSPSPSTSTSASGSASALGSSSPTPRAPAGGFRGPFCLFSKHLPDLAWDDLGRAVSGAGFDGIDLTVRPKGHVLPARVTEDLPRAVEAIQAAGSRVVMLTTALASAEDPAARATIAAAAKAGVRLLKPDYYRYRLAALADAARERADAGRQLASLAALAAESGIVLGYHNHTGLVGGPTLDFLPEIEALPAAQVGLYFDPRHAVVEGGGIGWKVALAAALPRLRMISVKDVRWERDAESGRWRDAHVPMGQGMVDWPACCRLLAQAGWQGPVSVHVEYPVGGATPDERRTAMLAAAGRELAFIKARFAEAYPA